MTTVSVFIAVLLTASWSFAKPPLGKPDLIAPVVIDQRVEGDLWIFPRSEPEDFAIEAAPLIQIMQRFLPEEPLETLKARQRPDGTLRLSDLRESGFGADFDEASVELRIRIPLNLRQSWFLDLNRLRRTGPEIRSAANSGYLNLRMTQGYVGDEALRSKVPLQGRVDLVQQSGGLVFESGANYREHDQDPWVRQDTRFVLDWEDRLVRWQFGDLSSAGRGFQVAPRMAGISARREFAIRPERTATRLTDTEIFIKRDSIVQFWINGSLYSEVRLPAGRFSLREFPLLAGFNKVQVRIRDDLGQEERFDFDLLFESSLLENGVQEFSYNFGFPWRPVGADRAYDGEALFTSVVHRMGVSDVLTIGVNFQNWYYRGMAGLEAMRATRLGLFSLDGALSYILGVAGGAGRFRWRSPDRIEGIDPSWRFGFEYERRSDTFFVVTADPLVASGIEARTEIQASRKIGARSILGVTLFHDEAFFNAPDRRGGRASLMVPLSAAWRLELGYQQSSSPTLDERGTVTLSWIDLPGRFSASASHETSARMSSLLLHRSNRQPTGDARWTVSAQAAPDMESGGISLEGLGRIGKARLDHVSTRSGASRQLNTSVGLDTAVVWADGVAALSQPVSDAFVLVRTRQIPEEARVLVNPVGDSHRGELTSRRDRLVIGELSSYSVFDLNLDGTALPMGSQLEREWFRLRPGYRSGVLITQDLQRRVLVRGRLVRADGQPWALLGGEIEDLEGRLIDSSVFTNRDGRFVVEGLKPGSYRMTFGESAAGAWVFTVPEGQGLFDSGEIALPPVNSGEGEDQ